MSDIQTDPAAKPATAEVEVPEPEAATISPGAALREAREQLGYSIEEAASRTKLAPRQILALEADDFAQLPEAAFVRGFVRSYAKVLQIDPVPLVAALPGAPVQTVMPEPTLMTEGVVIEQKSPRSNLIWLLSALAVAVMLAVFAWLFDRSEDAPDTRVEILELPLTEEEISLPEAPPPRLMPPEVTPAPSAPQAKPAESVPVSTAPVAAPETAAKPVKSADAPIRVVFEQQSWLEITDRDGKVLLSKVGNAGEVEFVDGAAPFGVVVGFAKGVKLYFKGKPIDLAAYARSEVARLTLEN